MKNILNKLRRTVFRHFVPEIFWPKTVQIGKAIIPVRGQPFSFGVKRLLVKGDYERHRFSFWKSRSNQQIRCSKWVGRLVS